MTTTSASIPVAIAGPRTGRTRRRRWFRPVYLLILAWLVGVLGPYIWMFISSITPESELGTSTPRIWPSHPTFAAYGQLLTDTTFLAYFFNSIVVAVGTVILVSILALLAGTALSRFRFRGRTALMYGILVVQLFPTILLITPLYIQLKTLGLLNNKIALILVYTAFSLGFATWLMKSFIDQIPVQIEQAAMVDGCSRFRAFIYVILPLAQPGIVAAGTFAFIYSWNEFLFALTFTSTTAAQTLPVGLDLFIGQDVVQWERLTAGGVIAAIPILIGFMFAQKRLISGITSGAIKG
jgi:multiple sugar transport system permease protein